MDVWMVMLVYSLLLILGLVAAAPWWGWRMATSNRYREGLAGRLGRVPRALREACAGKRVVWVHAVSVGEVLAVARLVGELRAKLGDDWVVAVSTTTATGQTIARERLGATTVFWFPLEFGFAVRAYLRSLRPELLVLVEGELWPRVLWECEKAGVPVVVVNARISDRSYKRTLRVRRLWGWMGRRVTVFLAQGEETAARLRELGVAADRVRVSGNLKYDVPAQNLNHMAIRIRSLLSKSELIVAGSTLQDEEQMLIQQWPRVLEGTSNASLLLAPRHPDRFAEVTDLAQASGYPWFRCSQLLEANEPVFGETILVLDTIGDLAATYGVADAAFVGGSLVAKGGHNPLEAARFGVPVVMGLSYENFREIVDGMRAAEAIRMTDADGLAHALVEALRAGKAMGERGRVFFEGQAGATERTISALLGLIVESKGA